MPLYLVVLNIYEQSYFFRSELKSIKMISKIPEKKFTYNFFILIFYLDFLAYMAQSFTYNRVFLELKILVH